MPESPLLGPMRKEHRFSNESRASLLTTTAGLSAPRSAAEQLLLEEAYSLLVILIHRDGDAGEAEALDDVAGRG